MRITSLLLVAATAACAIDEDTTETITSELSEYQWTDDVQVPGQSAERQPALAGYGGRLYMIHSGSGTPSELWSTRFNGSSWTTNVKLAATAASTVGLTVFDNQLVMVYQPNGQNRLVMSTSTNGVDWSTPVTAGSALGSYQLRHGVSLAVYNGRLYAGYCKRIGALHRVQIDRFDGTAWTSATYYGIPANPNAGYENTCERVVLGYLPDTNRLDIIYSRGVYTSSSGVFDTSMYESTGTGTTSLSTTTPVYMGMKSKNPMSIVTCDGETHLVHGGNQNQDEIWWSYRESSAWMPDLRVPYQTSDSGAAVGCLGGTRTIMVHNGGTNQLWQAEFGP